MMRVLFVDDEQPVLDGLRTRLHRASGKWHMEFVQSGALAVTRMQQQPYDVIVTDMRMPGMDGAQLLEYVSVHSPGTIRIVLSGYGESEQAVRLLPLAHQYMSKPCQPQQLESVIERCLSVQTLLADPQLRTIVGRIRSLPALPRVFAALQAIITKDSTTLLQVAQLVEADAAIAARILQIVNSAFFRLPRRISNLEQAVSYLGIAAIRNIAMSVEVFARWPNANVAGLDMPKLQEHAHAVAAGARALTAKTAIADDAMLAGLLHDIGYWILARESPQELASAVKVALSTGVTLVEAEKSVIGASHAEIGAYLLGLWGLPYVVIEAVAHHHDAPRVPLTSFDVVAAVATAHALVPGDDASTFDGAVPPDPRIDESYLKAVNAPFDWQEACRRVAETATDEVTP
jgi:putative nucleotidyltransferase with HDIG domain